MFYVQIKYDFRWLQAPIEAKKANKISNVEPLASLNVRCLIFLHIIVHGLECVELLVTGSFCRQW